MKQKKGRAYPCCKFEVATFTAVYNVLRCRGANDGCYVSLNALSL